MAKKRPRIKPRRPWNRVRAGLAREHVEYWRGRLFKNTFTYKGRRFHVNHWSVKIQHRGARKTFSLRAEDPTQAATEASRLYKTILTRGWRSLSQDGNTRDESVEVGALVAPRENTSDAEHWTERLLHRKYTEKLHANAQRELSVHIQHTGISHY